MFIDAKFVQTARLKAEKHPLAAIGIFLILLLAPFLNKAVHMDDSLFIWTAEQILKHPGNFYGFDVNWYGNTAAMSAVNCNPPTTAYLLAGVAMLFGWREIFLHGAMMFVTFAAAAGIFQLARDWCERPLLATFIAVSTPVFLVSATTLMCDVPMLAAWIWSLALWERALKNGRPFCFFLAALLAGLAVLTKYSALTLLPLLPILGLLRKKKTGRWLLWLAVPAAMIQLYQSATAGLYGKGLISAAADYAAQNRFTETGGWASKVIIGLAFAGGCLLPALFLFHRLWAKRELLPGGAVMLALSGTAIFGTGIGHGFGPWFQVQMAVMLAAGIHLVALALAELWRRRDPVALMLVLWLGSSFLFAAVLNWTVSARSFLPLVPAAAILIVRCLTWNHPGAGKQKLFFLPVFFSAVASLLVAAADYSLAGSERAAAQQLTSTYSPTTARLWFEGHWGLQFYLEKSGALPVDFSRSTLVPGEILIVPSNNSNLIPPDSNDVEFIAQPEFSNGCWLSTVSGMTSAGFYGGGGRLPFVIGAAPVEKYYVCRILRAMNPQYFIRRARPEDQNSPEVLNNIAWQLATNPDAKLRDGNQAVELAERACRMTGYRETVMVGTLAAAYAEAGKFDDAIATAQKACALAAASDKPDLLKINQQLLELYRQHLPYHEVSKP